MRKAYSTSVLLLEVVDDLRETSKNGGSRSDAGKAVLIVHDLV